MTLYLARNDEEGHDEVRDGQVKDDRRNPGLAKPGADEGGEDGDVADGRQHEENRHRDDRRQDARQVADVEKRRVVRHVGHDVSRQRRRRRRGQSLVQVVRNVDLWLDRHHGCFGHFDFFLPRVKGILTALDFEHL